MPRRILVLSASVGAGHMRAAQAVELALRELDPQAKVTNFDVLEMTNAAFRRVYGKSYLDLVNRAPYVLGYFYDLLDEPRSPRKRSDRLRQLVEKINLHKFLDFLRGRSWDVIVSTHFLPAEMIALLRQRGELATPHFTVTTDFETHRLWVNSPCDHYFTATEDGAVHLAWFGVPPETISVTGIPIHPVFSEPKEQAPARARMGLGNDRPVVLQLCGGFGVGPVEKLVSAVLEMEQPVELVVVTGKNARLQEQLRSIKPARRHRLHVLGFTDQMDELMAAADVVVSKPGGLTTSETLARGAAMVIVNPIPGQESRNSDYLLEQGAAVKINQVSTLSHKLGRLLADPVRLAQLRSNARRIGRPQAAFEVARRALLWPNG
jgi:processive 1,2-diacylglycerol beta-glucosyltransferase